MRPVIDDIDILEHPSPAVPGDECYESSRRAYSPVFAWLGRLFTPVPRLRPRRQERYVPGVPRVETSLDILARDHPDIHLWVMARMG
jgi:hypothetical protein